MSGDDRDYLERDKKSFSERDRERRERRPGDERRPRGPVARERSEAAAKQYLREIDGVFTGGSRKQAAAKLGAALRAAHGTPGLDDACRAYHAGAGLPDTAPLVSFFLDARDPELVLLGLQALRDGLASAALKASGSLRSQLRILVEGADDRVAEAAEELLETL